MAAIRRSFDRTTWLRSDITTSDGGGPPEYSVVEDGGEGAAKWYDYLPGLVGAYGCEFGKECITGCWVRIGAASAGKAGCCVFFYGAGPVDFGIDAGADDGCGV